MTQWTPEMLAPLAAKVTNPDRACKTAAAVLNGTKDPDSVTTNGDYGKRSVQYWLDTCFHRPSHDEIVLYALNLLFETHGVEAINVPGYWVDNFHGDIVASYLNTGDTYGLTLVHESETGEFKLTSYGDWLEQWERDHPEVAAE